MSFAYFIDLAFLVFGLIFPAYLIFRFSKPLFTIPCAALAVWLIFLISGALISRLDSDRDAAVLDSLWLLFGWIGGLIYAILLYLFKRIIISFHRFTRKKILAAEQDAAANP